jgi:hypothetical protein
MYTSEQLLTSFLAGWSGGILWMLLWREIFAIKYDRLQLTRLQSGQSSSTERKLQRSQSHRLRSASTECIVDVDGSA